MSKTIITISRQYGSNGHEIGKKLAEELNVPFYDNELIKLAAKKSGYSEEVLETADQTAANSLLYSLSMFGSSAGMFDLPLNDKLFLIQSDIIRKIADNTSCVIVGRCSDYILENREDCLHVFIHAKQEIRVQTAIAQYNLPREKAAGLVQKMDKKRATYYNYYTGNKWGDHDKYHLSLDSGFLGVDGCVELLKTAVALQKKKG